MKRSDARAPIDHFFRTLAATHEELAICVILSGTGSDGSLGLERIKEQGGLTIAQDPAEAEFDGMPQNAIATGHVDIVLPVGEIPTRIVEYVNRFNVLPLVNDDETPPHTIQETLQQILSQVQFETGHDFTRYKTATILRRVQHRMQILNVLEMDDYLALLRVQPVEIRALFNDFLITVTNFFRNADAFESLEMEVIPKLFEDKKADESVRVWVVGCATGEEAYTVAMLLLEYASQLDRPPAIQVFASDLSEGALRKAREGFYPEVIATDVSMTRLQRFFVKEAGGYRVRKEVREKVIFAPHNLLKDPPFSRIDLITCRNVLIYMERELQREIFELFHYALRSPGFLFLGSSEVLDDSMLFRAIDRKHSIYRRQTLTIQDSHLPALPLTTRRTTPTLLLDHPVPVQQEPSFNYGVVHGRLLERYAPPSILVDRNYNIVHVSMGISRFLHQPPGAPTYHVLERVREEFRTELTAALYRAFERGEPSMSRPITLQLEGALRQVVLGVWPANDNDLQRNVVLVIFNEREMSPEMLQIVDSSNREMILDLEEDLASMRKRLQIAMEEFETSQEEMKSSNEELQSMNEELRSTAEELETSKEELQSINEELITVNQENKNKVEELSQLASDLQNLLASTDIPTLFLDRELRITRFTPRVNELFNLRPVDRDRPLAHITHKLADNKLLEDAATVLRTLVPIAREVTSEAGRGYLMRLLPYRTIEDKIDGVVITFVDITERIQSEQALQQLTASLDARVTERTEQVRLLASRLLMAEQQVQERIAQILHDDLQQLLYSANMHLKVLKEQLPPAMEPTITQLVDEIDRIVTDAIHLTRRLTTDMAPPVLDKTDLLEWLQGLATRMEQMHGLSVTIEVHEIPATFNDNLRLFLYQMVRELLFNVVKHSGVKEARVKVCYQGEELQVTVEDKGKGFDPAKQIEMAEENNSFGLSHLNGQLSWQGGRLEVESKPGYGTRVTICLPLPVSLEASTK